MARVEVGKGRCRIENTPDGLRVTIPSKRNIFMILFLGFWLIGWAFGEFFALGRLLSPGPKGFSLFMVAWLGGWTIGGAFAIYAWLWNVMGREIVNITYNQLQHVRAVAGIRRSKEYELSSVSKLRVRAQDCSMFGTRNGMEFWGLSGGSIVFDYGHATHNFGVRLDEAEADHIVSTIKQRYTISDRND